MTDAQRWQHCITHGFPVRKQGPSEVFDRFSGKMVPQACWTAFGPGNIRADGHSPNEAVDGAINQTIGLTR